MAGDGIADGGRRAVSSFRCEVCDYVYDEDRGEPREGFPAGTPWSEVPDDWCCPDCGVREKVDFVPVDAAGQGG
jgi:rubredoxin